MTGAPHIKCSAAPRWRDRHLATDRQYHLTDPAGRQYTFCSACCLLSYAVHGLMADVGATDRQEAGNEAAA